MIKQIATNVDELLVRYNNQDTINKVSADTSLVHQNPTIPAPDNSIDMIVGRLERLERDNKISKKKIGGQSFKQNSKNCIHCSFINRQLGTSFNIKHDASNCSRRKISVNVIESMDLQAASDQLSTSDSDEAHQSYILATKSSMNFQTI